MLKIERTEVAGLEAAIREMHYTIAPHEKSDSGFGCGNSNEYFCDNCSSSFHCTSLRTTYNIGPNDFSLIRHLRDSDADYRKFLRTITVYADITAPLYWWTGFDIPTAGMTTNLYGITSKIENKEFTLEDFSCEYLDQTAFTQRESQTLRKVIDDLNYYRKYYLSLAEQHVCGSDKRANDILWQMIQLLPSSYNQKKMVTLNYEILMDLYESHQTNKFDEWSTFCNWVEVLPYSELIIIKENAYAKN